MHISAKPTALSVVGGSRYIYFIDCSIIKFTRLKHLVVNSGKNTLPKEEFWFEKIY